MSPRAVPHALGLTCLLLLPLATGCSTTRVAVFAPGVVSTSEPDLFRGQFAEDGRAFYFFRKVTPGQEDYRIFVTRRGPDGWGPARRVDLGGESSDLYPAVSPDGRHLVFSSYRPVPGDDPATANANLWVAARQDDGWGEPRLLAAASSLDRYDAGPAFDPAGDLVWTSVSADWSERLPRRATWEDGEAGAPTPDAAVERWHDLGDVLRLWHATPDPLGRCVVLNVSRVDREARRLLPSDLWIAHREGDGWGPPRDLGPAINTEDEHENFVVFTPDGSELLFCRGFRTYLSVPTEALLDASAPASITPPSGNRLLSSCGNSRSALP